MRRRVREAALIARPQPVGPWSDRDLFPRLAQGDWGTAVGVAERYLAGAAETELLDPQR